MPKELMFFFEVMLVIVVASGVALGIAWALIRILDSNEKPCRKDDSMRKLRRHNRLKRPRKNNA